MKKLILAFLLVAGSMLAAGAASGPVNADGLSYAPATWHSQSFCPSGCDSTATTSAYTMQSGRLIVDYCAGGGSGGAGGTVANVGGGGGGAPGTCYHDVNIDGTPGTVLDFTYTTAPSGPAAGSAGVSGFKTTIAAHSGSAIKVPPPIAWPGGGGATATASGGIGGTLGCTNDNSATCGTASGIGQAAGGAGGASTGTNAPNQTGSASMPDSRLFFATPGAGGGGTSGGGVGKNIVVAATSAGGSGNATDGGGGAGSGSMYGAGGAGGNQGGAACTPGGQAAGGGGGNFNTAGCKGGDPIIVVREFY